MACCNFPELDICDVKNLLPSQYRSSANIISVLEAFLQPINVIYRSINNICSIDSCDGLTDSALTNYGESIGFPRVHCNGSCSSEGDYIIDNDDFYCRLLKCHLIVKTGKTIDNLCKSLDVLFGPDSFVISSKNGVTKVSSGRTLTQTEFDAINIIIRTLPRQCGTTIELYDIENLNSIVGVNCGPCNNFAPSCAGFSALCNPITCDSGYIPDPDT